MHQIHIDLPKMIQRILNRLLCNLAKHHPLHRHLRVQQLHQMPTDRLPLPVLVRRKNQLVRLFQQVLQARHNLLLIGRHHIQRLEIIIYVDSQIRPRLSLVFCRNLLRRRWKIPDMPHGRIHNILLRKILLNRLRFGWGLNNN